VTMITSSDCALIFEDRNRRRVGTSPSRGIGRSGRGSRHYDRRWQSFPRRAFPPWSRFGV
jgi:hypothetical protein